MYKDAAIFDQLRSLGFASIGAGYTAVGTPLSQRTVVIAFKNATNGDVVVSIDGTNDYLFFPASTYGVYDVRTNAPNFADFVFPIGTQFYVKQGPSAPGSGTFYIEALIARTQQ